MDKSANGVNKLSKFLLCLSFVTVHFALFFPSVRRIWEVGELGIPHYDCASSSEVGKG